MEASADAVESSEATPASSSSTSSSIAASTPASASATSTTPATGASASANDLKVMHVQNLAPSYPNRLFESLSTDMSKNAESMAAKKRGAQEGNKLISSNQFMFITWCR